MTTMTASAEPIRDEELEALFTPLREHAGVVLAVSGGADSMTLMVLAARWREGAAKTAPALHVASVDHGLRPAAAEEAAWVSRQAAKLGLPHAVLRWEGPVPASGLQAAARAARYDLLAAHATAHGLACVATAHHLDDQAETVLMRLARGSGVDGLSGIAARGVWAGTALARPLLEVPKARLIATLKACGLSWIEDPSNQNDAYERNRVRRAMSQLAALGVGPEQLALSARRMARARAALEAATDRFLADHVAVEPAGYCVAEMPAFRSAPDEIAIRALGRMLLAVGGGAEEASLSRLEVLHAALCDGEAKARTLAGCRLAWSDENLTIVREPGRRGLPALELAPGESVIWDRRFRVTVAKTAQAPVTVRALRTAGCREIRTRLRRPLALPQGAARTLASFWQGKRLLAVPNLEYAGPAPASDCRAEFLNAALLGPLDQAKSRPSRQSPSS